MMGQYLKKLCMLMLLVAYGRTQATVENGGYTVSVSFTQNIQPEEGKVLLENLKESLNDASAVLNNAIGLHFAHVTVQIPPSWDTSEWNISTSESSAATKNLKPDFLVDGTTDVVFGKFPHAHQHASCGIPGHQIVIPTAFFSENNTFPRGTTLAREWLKYRYGVFDENGFSKDPLYPLYYVVPGGDPNEVKITDCTNIPVAYDFVDKSEGKDCSELETTVFQNLNAERCDIKPHNGSLENVTSSIMYYQEDFDNMQHICGKDPDHKHNSRSPNKQNALCYGRSIWEVVQQSPDLKSETTTDFGEIQFTYVQEDKPKLVVAWENTVQMKKKQKVIANGVKQIMIDLPDGSHFIGFPFDEDDLPNTDYTFHELKGLSEKRLVETSMHFDFVKPVDVADINMAIEKAMEILSEAAKADTKADGTIILITRSSETLEEELIKQLKDSDVCIMLMFFSEDAIPEGLKATFDDLPCATVKEISLGSEKDEEAFENLYNGMRIFLPSIVDDKESKMVKTRYLSKDTPISVEVDDSIETVTFWVYSKMPDQYFQLKFNDIITNNSEIKTENIGEVKQMAYSVPQAGKIEFSFPYEETILTQVRVTSKAGKYFSGEVLIYDTSKEDSPDQMPVIIYAFIRYGAYPIQNAEVSAKIQRPDGENITLDLYDNGAGDPDITQNDGIYSRYFTSFSNNGDYIVTVTVKNNGKLTSYGADTNTEYKTCCGSYLNGDTPKLEEFSMEFVTTFTAKSGRPNEGYKPSRIVDLRIAEVSDDKITLKWTAPGEEADHGTASTYEIQLFCDEENATDCNMHELVSVLNQPPPLNYGREQDATIQILTNTLALSVGITAINKNNKSSEISNIIQISTPTDKLIEVTETPDNKEKNIAGGNLTKGAKVGFIVLGILFGICILTVIIFQLKKKSDKRRRKTEAYEIEGSINEELKTNSWSVKTVPLQQTDSLPVMLYTHDQIRDRKEKNKNPPLYKSNISPKAWASLDVISSARDGQGDRETKSLGSSSTIDAIDELERKKNNDNKY